MFHLKRFDFYLFLPVVFLLSFSIVTIASVSPANLQNHLFYIFLGLIFFYIFSYLDLNILTPFSLFLYFFCIIFLTLPLVLGTVTRGVLRWVPIGSFTIQPSEIVKPFWALISSWFWAKDFSFKRLLVYFLSFLPISILIFFQPDLGSTLVLLSIFLGTVVVSNIKLKHLLFLGLTFFLVLPVFNLFLKDYQKERIVHFLNPESDPLGKGYNLIQAKIAVGSGGLLGRGLGRGTQSHLAFLPERYTDFIFASLAEEFGIVGSFLVLFFYLLLLFKILKICRLTLTKHNRSSYILSTGIFFYLFFQITVNIGMNIGLLPITGITLPLLSYGGSSLLATMISLGMLENIVRNEKSEDALEIK